MFGCQDVIPPKLKNIDKAWIGTDNDSSLKRFIKGIQYWLAIGPRGKHWYCETGPVPKTFFQFSGKGLSRYENADGSIVKAEPAEGFLLSRIQIWNRFNIAMHYVEMRGIKIPCFFFCHIYWRQRDVVEFPKYKSDHGILKKFVFQLGYKFDGDRWMIPTTFIGGNDE